jgi:hypothetical protein
LSTSHNTQRLKRTIQNKIISNIVPPVLGIVFLLRKYSFLRLGLDARSEVNELVQ